jgi:hypothetical protein
MEQLSPTFLPRIEGGKPTSGSPGHFAHGYSQHGLPPARGNPFGRRTPLNNRPTGSGLFGGRSPGKTPGKSPSLGQTPGKLPAGLYKGAVGPLNTPPGGQPGGGGPGKGGPKGNAPDGPDFEILPNRKNSDQCQSNRDHGTYGSKQKSKSGKKDKSADKKGKDFRKKKRNQHLNRQVEVNGEKFEFERDIIEKKSPSHGTDFGLEPDYGPDGEIIRDRKTGKPLAKQNKKNYQKFTDNLEEFIKDPKSERIEPQYRKGRENEQDAVGFFNRRERRFVIFNRHTKKYITGWVMNDLQYEEFLNNNNII